MDGKTGRMREAVACGNRTTASIAIFVARVPAGFPSPADDHLDRPLDFNDLLIAHPAATFRAHCWRQYTGGGDPLAVNSRSPAPSPSTMWRKKS